MADKPVLKLVKNNFTELSTAYIIRYWYTDWRIIFQRTDHVVKPDEMYINQHTVNYQ